VVLFVACVWRAGGGIGSVREPVPVLVVCCACLFYWGGEGREIIEGPRPISLYVHTCIPPKRQRTLGHVLDLHLLMHRLRLPHDGFVLVAVGVGGR
jgi:hypothetical protein